MASHNTLVKLREEGHRWFAPLWKGKAEREGIPAAEARTAAYRWLRKELNLSPHRCHFSRMTAAQLRKAIELCKQFYKD